MVASTNKTWFGGNGSWSLAGNWRNDDGTNSTATPGTTAIVYFNGGGIVTTGGQTVTAVVINGDVTFAGTGFTASNRIEVYATVTDNMTSSVIVGSSTGSGYYIAGYGYWNHASGAHSWTIYGYLEVNLDQHATAGTMTFAGPAAAYFSPSGGTRHSVTIAKNSNVQFTMYADANCTRANTSRLNHTGGYLNLNGYGQTCSGWTASGTRQIAQNADITITGISGTVVNNTAPTTCYSREGYFRVNGNSGVTVTMGAGTAGDGSTYNGGAAIGTAPQLALQNNITYNVSGNVLNLYCDGIMAGTITIFNNLDSTNASTNMPSLTLTFSNCVSSQTRDFTWYGTISTLNFTPGTGTGCTYNLNYVRASGVITASSNSHTYNFNDVNWTASAAQCNGQQSLYTFGDSAETKWTTGGLTCNGNASTYNFNNLNPTGASILTCSATTAVSGAGATYNYNYVRGTAALGITVNGLGANNHNIGNVAILGDFTFNVSNLTLNDQWLVVKSFLTSSASTRTINFNDRRIVTSLTGFFDSTTITSFVHTRGYFNGSTWEVEGSGGIQLGGSGSSVFGAASTTQSLRVYVDRGSGLTTTFSSGNIRSLELISGNVTGTVTINVDSVSAGGFTGPGTTTGLNLTMSSTTNNSWDYSFSRLGTVTFTGVAVWSINNLSATNLACNANAASFFLYGYCDVTTAVTLTGTGSTFWLYNVSGSTLTATSGSNNNYRFELYGDGTDRGFSTSMALGTGTSTGSQYTLVYVRQTGSISCQGSSGFSTYDFYDVQIRNATTGVTFNTRGNFNLYGNLYTGQFNMGSSDGFARVLNFNPDGSYSRNIYVSTNSGSTCLNISNLSALTISGRGDQDSGIIIVNNWFGTGAGSITLATSGILTNGANVPSIRIDAVKPSVGTGSVYHFKTFRGAFDVSGGISNTGQTITVYGGLYISDTPFYPYGSIGINTFVSTNFVMGRTDSTVQTIQTASNQGFDPQSLRIGNLTFNGANTLQLVDYTQVTNLTFSNGTIDLNGSQLYVQTAVVVTNNANQKYIGLNNNDIYIAATTGSPWTCTDTNNVTCTGAGNVQIRGGTVNSGGTTRKYNDQVNFYLTGEGSYALTSPFTCRNLTTNNYTPPASWTLYVGGNLTWNWLNAWTAPTGTVNFFATNASVYLSSNQGQNASYSLPTINIQNGTYVNVAGAEVTFGTMNCTANGSFRLLIGNALCTTLLNVASASNLDIAIGTLVLSGSGGTQTTSGLYMAAGSSLVNSSGTIQFTGSGEKYCTIPNAFFISNLINSGAFNSGTLTGYLNMYNSFDVDTISNTVNPSGFRQQTASSNMNVNTFSVGGTSGARAYWRNPATSTMLKTAAGNVSTDYIDVAFSTVQGTVGQLWYAGNNSVDSGNNVGWIFSAPATYSLSITGGLTTIGEGNSFTVVLTTTGVSNGTNVAYTISGTGITTGDIGGAGLTGNFTVSSGTASVTFNVTADGVTEGTESFTLSLNNGQASISISITDATPTYFLFIVGSLSSVNEGSSFTVGLAVSNLPDGSTIPYTITGISSSDISGASLTGNFTTAFSEASATFVVAADGLLEGPETFTLTLNGIGTNVSLLINDTSRPAGGDDFFMFFPV